MKQKRKYTPEKCSDSILKQKVQNPSYLENFQLKAQKQKQYSQQKENYQIYRRNLQDLVQLQGKFSDFHTLNTLNTISLNDSRSPYFSYKQKEQLANLESQIEQINLNKEEIDNTFSDQLMLFSQKSNFTSTDDYSFRNASVEKSNDYYKNENVKLHKIIIQMKLKMYKLLKMIEEALSIQKQELKIILDQYQEFIDKLLADKKQLSYKCDDLQNQLNENRVQMEEQSFRDQNQEDQNLLEEIELLKQELLDANDFSEKQQKKILRLEQENAQMNKISNELEDKFKKMEELMVNLDNQKHIASSQLQQHEKDIDELKNEYEKKMEQLIQQHEYEFQKFEEIVKDTIQKKDDCIDQLNLIIRQTCYKHN